MSARVVGDHDPHGISALIARARAGLALDDELRVQRLQPVAEARQTRIARRRERRRPRRPPRRPEACPASALEAHRGLGGRRRA